MEKIYRTRELQEFLAEKGMIWDGEYLTDNAEQDGRRYVALDFVGERFYPKRYYSMVDSNCELTIYAEEQIGQLETFAELSGEWLSHMILSHIDKASDVVDELDQKVYESRTEEQKLKYANLRNGMICMCENLDMMRVERIENEYNLMRENNLEQ